MLGKNAFGIVASAVKFGRLFSSNLRRQRPLLLPGISVPTVNDVSGLGSRTVKDGSCSFQSYRFWTKKHGKNIDWHFLLLFEMNVSVRPIMYYRLVLAKVKCKTALID
jgi:hypothetical protein